MNKKKYLAFDAIRFSFRMLHKHFSFIFKLFSVASLLLCIIVLLICLLQRGFITQNDLRMIVATLHGLISEEAFSITKNLGELKVERFIGLFITILIAIFLFICDMIGSKIAVILYDDKKISLKEIISCFKRTPSYLGAGFVYSSATRIGYRLFIIPGLLMQVRLNLCKYFIMDKNASAVQALRSSWNISKGHMLDMFMVSIMTQLFRIALVMLNDVLCALTMSSIIAFMITCYITFTCIFINACAHAFFYRKLLEKKQMQLTSTNTLNEDYNQISKPIQETLQL